MWRLQGVAYSAHKLGVDAVVVAPLGTAHNVRLPAACAVFSSCLTDGCVDAMSTQVSHATKSHVTIVEHGADFDASLVRHAAAAAAAPMLSAQLTPLVADLTLSSRRRRSASRSKRDARSFIRSMTRS
jgi:hypothetical protein